MSTDQLHGKAFEDRIKAALFRGAADGGRSATSEFDVEPKFDKTYFLATSIKSAKHSKSAIVGLSDASRFWKNDLPFRMLVGLYHQRDRRKEFFEVHEFLLHGAMHQKLKGDISYEEVNGIHRDMSVKNFPRGTHVQARAFVRERLNAIKEKSGAIILNPKIDSKGQRRLQCSVNLGKLIAIAEAGDPYHSPETNLISNSNYRLFTDSIGTDFLPFYVAGTARELSTGSQES